MLAHSMDDLVEELQSLLYHANQLGHRFEPIFVKHATSWDVFHLCENPDTATVSEEMKTDLCFYGYVVAQWLGVIGKKQFGSVPGMAEWAHNAHGLLSGASKYNGMHFLESSGWPVKLTEMARGLSEAFLGSERYRPPRDAAPPRAGASGSRARPQHSRRPGVRRLAAVGISYHTALLREPMAFWSRVLRRRFDVQTSVHVLDPSASTPEDVERLHSHCGFLEGAWCGSDDRLLRLNSLIENGPLLCHSGEQHQTRHPFITDAEAYHDLFVQLMGNDPILRAADVMLCGEPVLFCRLLSFFGVPVVGYISTPLSVYVRAADREKWYQDFYEMALDSRHIFAVTTPIFGELITYATGVDLPVVAPACLYTDASYWPVREREVLLLRTVSMFWDSQCILNHFAKQVADTLGIGPALAFKESTALSAQEKVGYRAFAEFLAAVLFPYALSQFWFYEFYAMAVPIYMPAPETLPLFVYQDYATCPDFEGHRRGHLPHELHPFSPFDGEDWDAMTYWTSFTDYLRFPHVGHFQSIPQLVYLLEREDHRDRSRRMQAAHVEHLGAATDFWLGALTHVANLRGRDEEGPGEGSRTAGEAKEAVRSPDELRDLSTRRPCGGSRARQAGWCWLANDGDTRQDHPHEYHFDPDQVEPRGASSSHWWVQLRRATVDPEVRLWARDCCCEAYGNRLWLLLGNSSDLAAASECGVVEAPSGAVGSTLCRGVGEFLFVEARAQGGWGYMHPERAVLMLPEVRVLSRD